MQSLALRVPCVSAIELCSPLVSHESDNPESAGEHPWARARGLGGSPWTQAPDGVMECLVLLWGLESQLRLSHLKLLLVGSLPPF